jgi:hypothetical protein
VFAAIAAGGLASAAIGCDPGKRSASSPASLASEESIDGGASAQSPAGVPRTTVLAGSQLATARRELAQGGSPQQRAALAALTASADRLVAAGPWSVIDKQRVPPSGDKHDYMSQAPYWWPADASPPGNAGTPGKCPYGQWDGVRNRAEIEPPALTDAAGLKRTFEGIFQLALAWYYTGDARYAARAELFARHWFLEPATLMHPNMNFAQGIPCAATGRGVGIIEASAPYLGDLVDGFAILDVGAPGWTASDQAAVRGWLAQFLTWLRSSEIALQEASPKKRNNHESWYDAAVASLALYLGQTSVATAALQDGAALIELQIARDGAQPLELERTMAWHYSNFNGHALCRLAEVGAKVGVNLWAHVNHSGASLATAIDYMIGGGERGASGFGLPSSSPAQTGEFERSDVFYELRAAAAEAMDARAAAALSNVPPPQGVDMWPLVPTCRVSGSVLTP